MVVALLLPGLDQSTTPLSTPQRQSLSGNHHICSANWEVYFSHNLTLHSTAPLFTVQAAVVVVLFYCLPIDNRFVPGVCECVRIRYVRKMSSDSSSTHSDSDIDISSFEESNTDRKMTKPVTNPVSTPSSTAAPKLTFSISRLLDSSSSPKSNYEEDKEPESPGSDYSEKETTSGSPFVGLPVGYDSSGVPPISSSSPTNSVIRVPAHRPLHHHHHSSISSYNVAYPWLAQTAAAAAAAAASPFIKDGLPSKNFSPLSSLNSQRVARTRVMIRDTSYLVSKCSN